MVDQTIEVDGETYRVETDDFTGEPYLEQASGLSDLLDAWADEHPSVVRSRHDEDVELGESFGVYVDLVGASPGVSNIGTGRTDASNVLADEGYELNVRCFEEEGLERADVVLSVEVVEQ
jgi:hypothetical protein